MWIRAHLTRSDLCACHNSGSPLEAGADVNALNTDNQSPLHLAAHHYSADVVKLLLAAGAEVNVMGSSALDEENLTPLGFALVTIIREQGASIGASDSEAEDDSDEERDREQHRRHRAIDLKNCLVVVSLLLRAGAHISAEEITRVVAASQLPGSLPRVLPDPLDRYLKKVIAAGGFTAYERAHRARLVAMLVPKLTHMPADAISHMVDFAFHVGFY